MTDDNQNAEIFYNGAIPEGYMPYTCSELTNELIEYARSHLNETDEFRNKSLRRIKRFIKGELDVFSELDDNLLTGFLRSRSFNFKKTSSLLKKIAEFIRTYLHYINRIDTETVSKVIASKAVGFLPYRDDKGRAIILLIAENWNPDDLNAEEMIFGAIVATWKCIENPVNQVAGFVVIADCKNISLKQFTKMSSWLLFFVQNLQSCCPIIIRDIYFIRPPTLFQLGWNIAQPFIKEDSRKKITFVDSSNWKILHDTIPPSILPEEVDGQLGPYSFEHWATDIPMIRKDFFDTFLKNFKEEQEEEEQYLFT